VNTCGFIEAAKEESIGEIFRFVDMKKMGKVGKILVGGCLSQRYMGELKNEIPEIDRFFGLKEIHRLDEILLDVMESRQEGKPVDQEAGLEGLYIERIKGKKRGWAYLKVTDGCSNHCSYCAIPSIRGPLKSRKMKMIAAEFRAMVEAGVKEINLIGQDIGSYGRDGNENVILEILLEELSSHATGDIWMRLLYLHPASITEKLAKIIRESPFILNYLDIPVQHGSNEILEKMNRRYSREYLYDLFSMLRETLDNLVLRTTVMAGFPGEKGEDFELLLRLIEDIRFDRLGGFTYSREEGTPAWSMGPGVSRNVAISRLDEIITVQSQISLEKNQIFSGKRVMVLVEDVNNREGILTGRHYGQAPEVDGTVTAEFVSPVIKGDFVNVRIYDYDHYDLSGKVVDEKDIDI
jgi:ribosomal protein S12 methylthiotransferase